MKREDFELHVSVLFYRTGGAMPPLQAYLQAREEARHGPPRMDLRHLRGFAAYLARVDQAAKADTTDIPEVVVKKVVGKVGRKSMEAILSRLSSPTRVVIAIIAEILLLMDQQDVLPVQYDDWLEWAIGTFMISAIALRSQKLETKRERIDRETP